MKRILITGAGGFAGGHLINHFVEQKDKIVYAVSYAENKFLNDIIPQENIFLGDLTDFNFTQKVIKTTNPDIVFHLAALSIVHSSAEKAKKMLTSNMGLQYSVLESVRQHAPSARVIAICSANEYGLVDENHVPIKEDTPLKPLNSYAVSKIAQDFLSLQYHLSYGLDVVRLRAFNHTGERQTTDFVIPAFAKQIAQIEKGKSEPIIKVGNLDAIRDFSDVKDIVRAYDLASESAISGEVYNVGSGKGIRISEILDILVGLSTSEIKIKKEKSRTRPSDVPVLIADHTKFSDATGWQPEIALEKTLERVLNYWRENI